MRESLFLFITDLKRGILSIPFLFSAFGVALAIFLSVSGQIGFTSDVLSLLEVGISGSGSIFLIIGILPLIPFATSFASEWEQRATSFWIVRTGIRNYSVSKILISGLSGFLVSSVGMLLFMIIMRMKLPLFSNVISTGSPYVTLLENDMPIRYLIYFIAHFSLGSVLFAVAGLWISTYIPNKFVAIASPLVLYFVAHRLTTQLDIPQYLKAVGMVEQIYDAGSPLVTLLLKLGTVVGLCFLMGVGTVRQIRRRVQHD
ncbi:hypothetical protein MUB24_03850 [Lederbergia sp. NSJ-179]|uniref:hypothetical protein n=1 Tax=Lederbergia sp. NSJ-179 TaxID=2931402 RepID=UPI001FD016ED|nr:hypothetical protein [Lederbergia sp. NSJ-179]MCJ7840058.1 hypothetical protein [Lederbergia sp. NSJ-179]